MREFFHGWRRKAGLTTLVVAMMLSGAWMRSYHLPDSLGDSRNPWLISHDGNLVWVSQSGPHKYPQVWDWYRFYTTDPVIFAQGFRPAFEWKCVRQRGFVVLEFGRHEFWGYAVNWLRIPYWTIALPLTLLSAYLILWPGKRATKQTAKD
ncbi:MAG: hypothetical protein JSS49_22550 [Planctomycetes bacterium]|nr:hypothetical protein [Planctomycetota bacterium]